MSDISIILKGSHSSKALGLLRWLGIRWELFVLNVLFRKAKVYIEEPQPGVVFFRHRDFLIETSRNYLSELAKACLIGNGDLCFGQGYVNGEWRILKGHLTDVLFIGLQIWEGSRFTPLLQKLQKQTFISKQKNTPANAKNNVAHHYDLGNDLYKSFLDKGMNYSAGIFDSNLFNPKLLGEAQVRKNRLLIDLLEICSDSKVLEIGCGWGELSRLISEKSSKVTGISLSEEQINWCLNKSKKSSKDTPSYYLQDYRIHCRENQGQYDRVVSIEMFDHVGKNQHKEFFDSVYSSLAGDGILVMQVLVRLKPGTTSRWIDKYIFPGAYIAAYTEIKEAFSASGFYEEKIAKFNGMHYATTLLAWEESFKQNWKTIEGHRYDSKFYRMWLYYLSASQMIFEKGGFYTIHLRLKKGK